MAERSGRLYFGVSDTPKGNLIKEVMIRNPGDLTDDDKLDLQVGDELIVKFNNGNNEEIYPQLKLMVNDPAQDVGPTGAIPTVTYPGYNEWSAQQLIGFVYCCGNIAGTEDETYYWKAFQIDKATADTYGVTKVFDQLNQLVEGTEDTPIGWGLINDMLEDRLDDFELNYTGQHHPDDWGTVTLEYPDSLYPSEGHETPNKIVDSFEVPAIINSTGDLNNNGDGSLGSKYWNNNENNVFNSASLGIGYHFSNHDNNDEIIRAYIPYALYGNDAINYIGRDALRLYQDSTRDADDRAVVGEPKLRTYGERIRLGLDLSYSGIYQGTTYNHTASENTRVEIGGAYLPANAWELWYTFGSDAATFSKPVNINNGININNVDLNTYVNSRIESHQERDLFIYGQVTSVPITYPAFENTSAKDKGSVPSGIGWAAINAVAIATGQYAPVYNSGGNCRMYIRHINNYVPIAVIGWNVQGTDEADDFYVWECWLSDITTSNPQVHFGLQNTRQKQLTVRFKVNILYVRSDYIQQFKIPSGTDPKWNLSNGNIRALNK